MKTKLFLSAALACAMAAPATTQAGPLADATSDMLWGIEISGYLDIGSTYAFSRPRGADRNILGYRTSGGGSAHHRQFNEDEGSLLDFHAFQLGIDRLPEDIDEVGFRLDMMYGEDAAALGGGDGVLDSGHFNLYQAYISYVAPLSGSGLTLDVGRFVSWHGYEAIESPLNDNYSRSLLFTNSVPKTHTGFRATYTIDEMWELSGGITQGWDTVENINDSYTGHIALRIMPMENVYIQNSVSYGAEEAGNNSDKTFLYDLIATWQVDEQLLLGANFNWANADDLRPDGSGNDAEWWGLAGYARYDVTDKLYLAFRGEYVEDRHNFRYDAFLPAGQNKVDIWEVTLTAGYEVVDGLLTRVEYRHDDANEDIFLAKDRLRSSQDTISWEIIYSF